ncbi:MAG: type VII secretion target [Mycolicibacterium neoaurum]|uniref:type VII secretion target n=1 Tax=Mycolicibacterium neoaurum TaxID=1795 RepID=UPI002FFD11A4
MFVDTAALGIRAVELARLSTDLAAVAADLPGAAAVCAGALGPIGTDFVAALTGALDAAADLTHRLAAAMGTAGDTTARTAADYLEADRHSALRLAL